MITGESEPSELWCPQCNCREIFNSQVHKGEKEIDYKQMVNEYLTKNEELVSNSEYSEISKKIFGVSRKKLF